MSRDGSGNYTLPSGNPVVTNTVISSTWANATLSDLGAALTQSLSKDGQTTPTANLTMGNFRLTALANAAARTDAITAGQVQDNALTVLSSVSGTDTITASSSPAIVAYATGSRFQFVSAGANATTAPTLNINGLGAKNIKKVGAISLLIGDIASGQMVDVIYDGTQFQLQSPQIQYAKNIQIFVSSGTFTPPAGVFRARGRVWAGGGGGGGMGNVAVGGGGGGGGGGYSEGYFACTPGVGITITVGTGGNGGAAGGNNGTAGGSSSIGALISATGGAGGTGFTSGTGGGGAGGTGSGGNGGTFPGINGQNGVQIGAAYLGGAGGGTFCTPSTYNASVGGIPSGNFPGGGGAGGTQNNAGAAAQGGFVSIEW